MDEYTPHVVCVTHMKNLYFWLLLNNYRLIELRLSDIFPFLFLKSSFWSTWTNECRVVFYVKIALIYVLWYFDFYTLGDGLGLMCLKFVMSCRVQLEPCNVHVIYKTNSVIKCNFCRPTAESFVRRSLKKIVPFDWTSIWYLKCYL